MDRRTFVSRVVALGGGLLGSGVLHAKTFLSVAEAQQLIWPGKALTANPVNLSEAQQKAIARASGTRVRAARVDAWKTADNGWFIVDQVIGKHENIDLALGLNAQGKVQGLEILVYRETYGHEIRNAKWRAQFHGRDHSEHLELDEQIRNISGATLSCSHVTDGVNRLTHTWNLVLRSL